MLGRRVGGLLAAAVAAVVVAGTGAALSWSSAAEAEPERPASVAELAQVLGRDHVLVEQTRGSGDTAGATARIERVAARLPVETFVAVIDSPPDVDAGTGASAYLATALSRRIGRPGLYVVSADGSAAAAARVVGTGWDQTLFDLQVFTDRDAVERASGQSVLAPTVSAETVLQTALAATPRTTSDADRTVSLPDDVVDDLAARQRALAPHVRPGLADLEEAQPWSTGKRWMVGTTVAAAIVAVVLQSLVGWPGWRRRPARSAAVRRRPRPATSRGQAVTAPDLAQERAVADRELTALAVQLTDAPPGVGRDHATLAREAAEPLLSSDDVLDVIGAGVMARAGRRELGRGGRARRTCFFDPRHAAASTTADWTWGDAEVRVPVCSSCQRDLRRARRPRALVVRTRGRLRPYYEGRSVWARTGFGSLTADLADLAAQVTAERRRSR